MDNGGYLGIGLWIMLLAVTAYAGARVRQGSSSEVLVYYWNRGKYVVPGIAVIGVLLYAAGWR